MADFAVGTIIASNYDSYARVLARSLDRWHPGKRLDVLVLDESTDTPEGTAAYDLVRPGDLPIANRKFHTMAAMYSVLELATAAKPWLLRLLLSRGVDAAIFLDPDMELFAPIEDIAQLAIDHGIVLTPHVNQPTPRDGLLPGDEEFLISGTFNLGFIAVGRSALPFLDWWEERLYTHCVRDIERGIFVDQRWIDLAVHYFPHHVLHDPGFNVAYWNLHERKLSLGSAGYRVDGGPLRAFHYSGYKPDKPAILSEYWGAKSRVALDKYPEVQSLCAEYSRQLADEGWSRTHRRPYYYASAASGAPMVPSLRASYRRQVLAGRFPPDPFDNNDGRAFQRWSIRQMRGVPARLSGHLWRGMRVAKEMAREASSLYVYTRAARKLRRERRRAPTRP
jgi:hypothetical protein